MTEILHFPNSMSMAIPPQNKQLTGGFRKEKIIPSEECKPEQVCFKFKHISPLTSAKRYSQTQGFQTLKEWITIRFSKVRNLGLGQKSTLQIGFFLSSYMNL